MFLAILLILIIIILFVAFMLLAASIGAGVIIIFGDVIVCIFILGWIVKKLFFR